MKELLNIYDYLVSAETMVYWEDDAHQAADKFNHIMHTVYDMVDDDKGVRELEKLLINISEYWIHDAELLDIEEDELEDWIKQKILQAEQGLDDDYANEDEQEF